jgi:G:T-mismatch repair DNA endonuclease (very short patch repair protein)
MKSKRSQRARTDVLTSAQRSWCMSQIKGKDTKPEVALRRALFAFGYRFRLGAKGQRQTRHSIQDGQSGSLR